MVKSRIFKICPTKYKVYIYIYIYVCVCVCVCARARARARLKIFPFSAFLSKELVQFNSVLVHYHTV